MRNFKLLLFFLIVLLGFLNRLHAQVHLHAGAEKHADFKNRKNMVMERYSADLLADNRLTADHYINSIYNISVVSGKEIQYINLASGAEFHASKGHINLVVSPDRWRGLDYQLYDAIGNTLKKKALPAANTDVDFANSNSGTFFLKVSQNNRTVKIFKIVKRNR